MSVPNELIADLIPFYVLNSGTTKVSRAYWST